MVDPEGTARELSLDGMTVDPAEVLLVTGCGFTADGKLQAVRMFDELLELDSQSNTFGENRNDLGLFIMELAGADVVLTQDAGYRLGQDGLTPLDGVLAEQVSESLKHTEGMLPKVSFWEKDAGYRLGQDGLTPLDGVLAEQVSESLKHTEGMLPKVSFWENSDGYLCESLKHTEGMLPKVSFWENSDGYLFFTTHEGLYSYVPGGSVTEMLVDGARTSLGDPTFYPTAITGKPDNSFYVLGGSSGGEAMLYHYVYDQDAPTQAGTQLRLYTLYEDEKRPLQLCAWRQCYGNAGGWGQNLSGRPHVLPDCDYRKAGQQLLCAGRHQRRRGDAVSLCV